MPKLSKKKRDREKEKRANMSPEQRERLDEAVKVVMDGKLARVKVNEIPWCKVPGCSTRAFTTRGLCAKHEELFKFIYFLFTLPDKKSDLLLPGEQEGGKKMTNFDMLIRGK